MDPVIVLFGLGVGVLIGATGVGGGSLMTPLLVLATGTHPVVAVGTDVAYGAMTKTVGAWRHLRQRTVDFGVAGWLAAGSIPGSLVGVWTLSRLQSAYHSDHFDKILLAVVAGVLLVVAVATLVRALFMRDQQRREQEVVEMTPRRRVLAVVLGVMLGVTLGITSVGSGALGAVALILVFRLTPHRVVGTDVFHASLLQWPAGIAQLAAGNVDLGLMGTILIGSIPGVWIGAVLAPKVPAGGLRPALGCLMLAAALGVSTKAGLDVPLALVIVAPLAVGALAWALHLLRRSPIMERPV